MFLSLIFHSKSCIQNCLNSSIRDTVLVTMATITISNIFFLSQGSSHNNIVKLQSDNIRDKKIIFLVLDPLKMFCHSFRWFCYCVSDLRWFRYFGLVVSVLGGYGRFVSMVSFWRFGF